MNKAIYFAITLLLCALFFWIYWETKAPPEQDATIVNFEYRNSRWEVTAIRSGPPRNEPHIVDREWPRWRKIRAYDCIQTWNSTCVPGVGKCGARFVNCSSLEPSRKWNPPFD